MALALGVRRSPGGRDRRRNSYSGCGGWNTVVRMRSATVPRQAAAVTVRILAETIRTSRLN